MELENMHPVHARVRVKEHGLVRSFRSRGVEGVIYERKATREGWYGVLLDEVLYLGSMATSVLHVSHGELEVIDNGRP